jgi:hypothetical protein
MEYLKNTDIIVAKIGESSSARKMNSELRSLASKLRLKKVAN